jgi:nucleoside-diphosphate-sugar epimerase
VQKEMMDPTVKGTVNVLKACSATNVKKLVLVSSAASLCFNPDWPEDKIKDESCWSDKEFCTENEVSNQQIWSIHNCIHQVSKYMTVK